MPWTDQPGPRPQRSEEELLEGVRRRAGSIRRARRARLSAAMGAAMAVFLVATAVARTGDDPPTQLQVVGPASTSSTAAGGATTVAPETTTSTSPAPAQTTTTRVPPTVPPTTPTAAPTTAAAPPATTAPVPATTSTTAAPNSVVCAVADVVVTATLDRASYRAGDRIVLTASASNRGSQPCVPRNPSAEVFDAAGALVTTVITADAFTMPSPNGPAPAWGPGETLSMTYPGSLCSCGPGQYTAVVTFGGTYRSAPAPFSVAP